jgi:O-antigen/teichoic acid export membrane protein
MGLALFMGLLLHITGPWLFGFVFKQEYPYRPFLQYAVFFALFRLFFDRVLTVYRARRKAVTCVVLSMILFAANGAAVLIAIFVQKTGLKGILNAQLMAYTGVTVVYLVFLTREVRMKWLPNVIKPGIHFVLPLVPHALLSWLLVYVSTIFIARNQSADELAVYTLAQRLALIMAIVNTALNQAWSPFIYANAEKSGFRELFQTNARKLLVFVLYICGIIILFSREILLLMGKEDYMTAITILPILLVGYLFQLL